MVEHSGMASRTCRAPCQSISSTTLLPWASCVSTGARAERLRPVADGVLLLGGQLRARALHGDRHEYRVVAETARAARLGGDMPLPGPMGDDRVGIVGLTSQHDHALIACLTPLSGHV